MNKNYLTSDEFNLVCYLSMYAELREIFYVIQDLPSNLTENHVLIISLIMSLVEMNIAFCVPFLNDINKIYYFCIS